MTTATEASVIAARLASASEVFPLTRPDDWDSSARVTAEGDALLITVTDHMGKATREYHARLVLIGDTSRCLDENGL